MKKLMKLPGIQKILKAKNILPEKMDQLILVHLITIIKKLWMIALIDK